MNKLEGKLSRVMSLVLRHDPASIGLAVDDRGWARIDDLVECLKRDGKRVDRALIEKITGATEEKRFQISKDGLLIRATEGHSIEIKQELTKKSPPEWLYFGTSVEFMATIEKEGLLKKSREYVQLFSDQISAKKIGRHLGKPVVLEIAARSMERHGFEFRQSKDGGWMTESVPPDYLTQRMTG